MTLLLNIVIALCLIAIFWVFRQPEGKQLFTRACASIAKYLDENVFSKEYRDEMIRMCIKDAFNMVEHIQESKDENEVEAWYWEVDKFDKEYRDKVPDKLLENHCSRLYNACHARRIQLRVPKVKVFDSPTINLS